MRIMLIILVNKNSLISMLIFIMKIFAIHGCTNIAIDISLIEGEQRGLDTELNKVGV